jgi:hypothetical protein
MSNPGPNVTQTSNLTQENVPQSDGHQVGSSSSSLVGFWGATPIVQPGSPTGNTHTPTAGSTTAVYVNTTFDGGITGTAYTVGDLVVALKNAGIIAV